MHRLLEEQLTRLYGTRAIPARLRALLDEVSATYQKLESTRADELHHLEQHFGALVEQLPAIVYVCEFGESCKCSYVSGQIKTILGYEPEDWLTNVNFWMSRIHPADRENALHADAQSFASGSPLRAEYRMIARDGHAVWVRDEAVVITDEHGKSVLQGLLYDITEQKQAEERLVLSSLQDSLTGLPNRVLLLDRVSRVVGMQKREPKLQFAVLCIDLDRFKTVNESIGHPVGDQLLVEFAARLTATVRPGDTVVRLGGDEFGVLVEDIENVEQACGIADRIHTTFKLPFVLNGQEIFTTGSIGVATGTTHYASAQDLIRDAETAMYRAKTSGKAQTQIFQQSMHSHVVQQLEIENDLRRAIQRKEFVVFYQPIVSLESGSITSAEALVRWKHPEKGFISPGDFIPIAEETGLINQLDLLTLCAATAQAQTWRESLNLDEFTISVNLSARLFKQKRLMDDILACCRESRLDPKYLKLEITETAMIDDAAATARMLTELKKHHVKISLDDFGTGYASLSQLYRFPIDVLKIDRSFVNQITPVGGTEIVRTIVQLAHNLHMQVTAEGIETETQLETLRTLGCEYGQGYYFAKPIDGETFTRLLQTRKSWNPLRIAS